MDTATFFAYKDKALFGHKLHAQSLTLGLTGGKALLANVPPTVSR